MQICAIKAGEDESEDEAQRMFVALSSHSHNSRLRCALTLAGSSFAISATEKEDSAPRHNWFDPRRTQIHENREKSQQTQRSLMKEQEPSTWKLPSSFTRRIRRYIPFWFHFDLFSFRKKDEKLHNCEIRSARGGISSET